jgi:hypothetical protein
MRTLGLVVLVVLCPLVLSGSALPKETDDVWTFSGSADGIPLENLIKIVHDATGAAIIYSPHDPALKVGKIQLSGPVSIPRTRVFDWFRAVLGYYKLVLVPIGPGVKQTWALMNANDPAIAKHPTHVTQEDLPNWSDRDGVYIVCALKVRHMKDTTRARNALACLSSRPTGRVNDVPGTQTFVVGDFAPVVCAMARLLEKMDVEVVEEEKPAPPAPRAIDVTTEQKIKYYEQMLIGSRTEVAAEYFLEKIEALQARKGRKAR